MIEHIEFENFRILRKAHLPLDRFTLLVGANGSGKSSVFKAIREACVLPDMNLNRHRSVGTQTDVMVTFNFSGEPNPLKFGVRFEHVYSPGFEKLKKTARFFFFDDQKIAQPARPDSKASLHDDGGNLAAVLDRIKDQDETRWESINQALAEWLPGFDRILFDVVDGGFKTIQLRTNPGRFRIPASELSQGTLIALAILTLSYLPEPPALVCLEEPDRGLHPRLLQDVQNAIRRLCYPEEFGEKREPVQVIATTHNPFFLDLFRDNPEQIVIAEKSGLDATFKRLSDHPHLKEIIAGVPLGEVWYSGVLGGVPAGT